jgi:glyoxalase family protein
VRHPIRGLHHVTATVGDAQADLDFSRGLLGLRLVKKTVNFDNHNVYHFYYGDAQGTPGTIWTTFPYKGWGVPAGAKGAGQVTATSFSIPRKSLGFWNSRLREAGAAVAELPDRFGDEGLAVRDSSGLAFELLANDRDARLPWTGGGVAAEAAVRGLHSVTLTVRDATKTARLMTDLLGFQVINDSPRRIRLAIGGDEPGKVIDVVTDAGAAAAVNGVGTVHHVAMAIDTADEQLRLREELVQLGFAVTEVRDRQYFRSIYFREPGGVLFEVATIPPGFTVDETLDRLGRELRLPPWEEPYRPDIERGLPRISLD